jgi:hypothetical protein
MYTCKDTLRHVHIDVYLWICDPRYMRTPEEITADIITTKSALSKLYAERTEFINEAYKRNIPVAVLARKFDMKQQNVSAVIKNNTTN